MPAVMANIMDYLACEFRTFEELPFGAVDALVLSQFCMVRMEVILPPMREESTLGGRAAARLRAMLPGKHGAQFKDALMAEYYSNLFTGLVPEKVKALTLALAASPRFREMRLSECASVFDEEHSTQFAALSFTYKNKFSFVGFRGTDCSFAGWREDFNMAYMDSVPSQERAVRYLEAVAPRLPGALMVGGHSKGGNLAMYAVAKCSAKVRERIQRVYALDAPGFREAALSDEEEQRLAPLLERIVPQESLIGMLMKYPAPYCVVESNGVGVWQHDPFTWQLDGSSFVQRARLAPSALFTADVIDRWLAHYSDEEAEILVNALFNAMKSSGAKDFSDVLSFGPQTFAMLRDAAKNTPESQRAVLLDAVSNLVEVAAKRAFSPGGTKD